MKKKSLKIILVFIFIFLIFINNSYAIETEGLLIAANSSGTRNQSIDEVIGSAENFVDSANTEGTISEEALNSTIDLIYNILLAVGLVVAVICGVILGIQFMMSSAEGQASVKEKLIPYAVGCVVIFGAFGIWKLVMILLRGF